MTRAQDVGAGFVQAQRARRASWAAIAGMAGCSEMDLRRRHDPACLAADWTSRETRAVAPNPRDVVRSALRAQGLSPDNALVIARLWLANGARCRSVDLAAGIAGGGAALSICAEAKRAARRLGIGFEPGAGGLAISPGGLLTISRLAKLPRGRP